MLTLSALGAIWEGGEALAGPQGDLRSVDTHLVYDSSEEIWVSLSSSESLSSPAAVACDPGASVWTKGYAYVPYRVGAGAATLADCWRGDALPNGPGSWAEGGEDSVRSPTLARIGTAWFLSYTAIVDESNQECIGHVAGDNPSGPNWFYGTGPLVCPTSQDTSAVDPEFFYDTNGDLYLLWTEVIEGCEANIYIREFDTIAFELVGTTRLLLSSTQSALGFDEVTGFTECTDDLRHDVGNPTMVRASDGNLWLMFSGNDSASVNHSTGWAICGNGSPVATGECGLASAFDPNGRYRPTWGWDQRIAPDPQADATPYSGFPNLGGFGGLSLTVPDPPAGGTQPVYATAQRYDPTLQRHSQVVLRLDVTETVPALHESEVMTFHGEDSTFGSVESAEVTPSGHTLSTRTVPDLAWPDGRSGIFNDIANDGTLFVSGGDHNAGFFHQTADDMVVGAYDPRLNTWTNIQIETDEGNATITAVDPSPPERPYLRPAGASVSDVQAIDDGNAIVFGAMVSFPHAYADVDPPYTPAYPPEGVWPAFGIITKVDGEWQVASDTGWINQWTGAELAQSVPRDPQTPNEPSISELACPSYQTMPAGESVCRGPNEMAVLPHSEDVVVALYSGDRGDPGTTGLMILDVTGPDQDGRYDVAVNGFYELPVLPDPRTSDPNDVIHLSAKAVESDPTSQTDDERFIVIYDIFTDTDDDIVTFDGLYHPGVVMEFSYDASSSSIEPVSGPIIPSTRPGSMEPYGGVGGAQYDSDGNLWVYESELVVYAKENGERRIGSQECPFDDPDLADYTVWDEHAGTSGLTIWAQPCRPDFEILQGDELLRREPTGFFGLWENPDTKTMVALDTWSSSAFAVRRSGTGTSTSFETSNVLETGRDGLPSGGAKEQRPGIFDESGRFWFAVDHRPPPADFCPPEDWGTEFCEGVVPYQHVPHWMASIDIEQLFEPEPNTLPASIQSPATRMHAEGTSITATTATTDPSGVELIASTAHMTTCTDGCPGWELGGLDSPYHESGAVEYQVYAPEDGTYQFSYRVNGASGSQILLDIDGPAQTTSVNTGGSWSTVAGPSLQLGEGIHTITLTPGGPGFALNWIEISRTN